MTEVYTGDEDPYRLIFSYTSHMKVPKWIDEKVVKECFHCRDKMGSNEKHNCRLCGNIFCDRCSGKYHIPLVFELKGKKGATRVCYGCRDSCIEQRNKEQAAEKNPTTRGSIVTLQTSVGARGMEILPPSEWADASKPTECKKCRKMTSKPRNCRLCGKCFDDKCTSKMNVPPAFERKQKSGPARVCDICRYKVFAGARLVEKGTSSPVNSAPSSASSSPTNRGVGGTVKSSFFATANPPVSGSATVGFGANRGVNLAPTSSSSSSSSSSFGGTRTPNKSTDTSTSNCITIKSEEGANTVLARIPVSSPLMTLTEINAQFKKIAPQKGAYTYVYRQQPIADTFYDMFTAGQLGNVIHLRFTAVLDAGLMKQLEQAETVAAAVVMKNKTTVSNPWKATENAAKQEELSKKKAELMKPKFHPPIIKSALQVDTKVKPNLLRASSTGAGLSGLSKNQQNKSSSTIAGANLVSVPAGKTVDDLFKMRAQQLFVKM